MLPLQERAELVAVARLYYEDNLTQAEIAARIGVSRPLISKMLAKAREVGIVHIEIRTSDNGDAELLRRLQERCNLSGGLVLSKSDNVWRQIADYLAVELRGENNVGLGWGYTVGEAIAHLNQITVKQQSGTVYPLIGRANIPHKGYHPDELVQSWGRISGRAAYLLQCQAFPASEDERRECESADSYSKIFNMWQQTDCAIIGIKGYPGVPDEATATRFGDALQKQRAVGSFLSYYYNERGEFISGNNDYCVHIPLALLQRCGKVVGIAADDNVKAVIGALKTGILTHLVISESTAQKILQA